MLCNFIIMVTNHLKKYLKNTTPIIKPVYRIPIYNTDDCSVQHSFKQNSICRF